MRGRGAESVLSTLFYVPESATRLIDEVKQTIRGRVRLFLILFGDSRKLAGFARQLLAS